MTVNSEPIIKLTRGVPALESFPIEKLKVCATAVLDKFGDLVLQYAPAGGFQPLRAWIAGQNKINEDRVVIGVGSLQLVDMLARILLQAGDPVYVENPTYDRTVTVLRRAGATITGFALDRDGLDVEAVEDRLRKGERPKLFYIIPDFQNPSGVVMSLERRKKLVALAEEYDFLIMEDVPYRKLRYTGEDVTTFFEMAPQRVVQMSSFSKLISPGMRVGFAIAPDALAKKLTRFAEDTYINPSYLNQAMVYEFIERGWFLPNLAALKALYSPRLAAMYDAVQAEMGDLGTCYKPDGGFFLGFNLKENIDADVLLAAAKEANLQLSDGRGFCVNGGGDGFIRLPFCALTPDEIKTGISRLSGVLRKLVK